MKVALRYLDDGETAAFEFTECGQGGHMAQLAICIDGHNYDHRLTTTWDGDTNTVTFPATAQGLPVAAMWNADVIVGSEPLVVEISDTESVTTDEPVYKYFYDQPVDFVGAASTLAVVALDENADPAVYTIEPGSTEMIPVVAMSVVGLDLPPDAAVTAGDLLEAQSESPVEPPLAPEAPIVSGDAAVSAVDTSEAVGPSDAVEPSSPDTSNASDVPEPVSPAVPQDEDALPAPDASLLPPPEAPS